MRNGGDHEDNEGGEELDSSGDLMGLKRTKEVSRKGAVQWILLPVWTVESYGERTVSCNNNSRATTVDSGDTW